MARVTFRLARVCALLFFSGACALTYQVAWFRELRLIFGASTAASAAVLAVFMGGLGIGGLFLGRRADKAENPLRMYAHLEIAVAILAALTPILVRVAETAYLSVGGSGALGAAPAAGVRLLLSVLVLGPSTLLMGGTLPAAARAVERESDIGRQRVAALYGVNTFGAVAGSLAANFLLLEVFGTQMTQWVAALVNLLVGVIARGLSHSPDARAASPFAKEADREAKQAREDVVGPAAGASIAWFPPAAAAIAGLTFMLMELVWYRMLAPILGGSSYTFGLILAVALVGIGIGGSIYARSRITPTLRVFAITCAVEGLFIAIPYALGDRLAMLSLLLRPLCNSGFAASVGVWAVLASIVVLPAAIVSGIQFPVVIGLYGHGSNAVGRDVGKAYFANTIGSIIGSIAGGFGLLPALGAPTCWRIVVILLAATAAIAIALDMRVRGRAASLGATRLVAPLAGLLAVAALLARGPTAVWRHAGIGAGRADSRIQPVSKSRIEAFERGARGAIKWEEDGRESSVAIEQSNGYSFIVNGKSDGHVILDAPTQVMSGLLGALLHSNPKKSLVIGLGTGSTAGWLGKIPSMDRVDVVELEPAILRVAKDCATVNEDVLSNPKVSIRIADAREALLTSREKYDIVFSEPSNPYRAGISSLYTVEYYRAAADRLGDGGLFIQWVQAYEIDAWAVATAMVTLREVFSSVSMWQTMTGDLLLVAQRSPAVIDVERMRARLEQEPYKRAARAVWRTSAVEGVLARHVANPSLADFVVEKGLGVVNHDDQNFLEFAFARGVGHHARVDIDYIELARRLGADVPRTSVPVDPAAMITERWLYEILEVLPLDPQPAAAPADLVPVGKVMSQFQAQRYPNGFRDWKKLGRKPGGYFEVLLLAYGAARANDPQFEEIAPLVDSAAERELLRAIYLSRSGKKTFAETVTALEHGFGLLRQDPWPLTKVVEEGLLLASEVAKYDPDAARRLFAATGAPFAAEVHRSDRLLAHARIGKIIGVRECVEAVSAYDPAPWDRTVLQLRAACYRDANDPRAARAEDELAAYLAEETSFAALVPPRPAPAPVAPPPAATAAPVDASADAAADGSVDAASPVDASVDAAPRPKPRPAARDAAAPAAPAGTDPGGAR